MAAAVAEAGVHTAKGLTGTGKGSDRWTHSKWPMSGGVLSPTIEAMFDVTFRISGPADDRALSRLAELDGARPPRGPAVIAEADSRIVAALPLGAGRAIADPFVPTADLVALLEVQKKGLLESRTDGPRRGRLRSLVRDRLSHARP